MTLTVEISPELSAQIERAASQRGLDAGAFVVEAARTFIEAQDSSPSKQTTRQQAITRGYGFLRGHGVGSSDEFLARRHLEARVERDKDARAIEGKNR